MKWLASWIICSSLTVLGYDCANILGVFPMPGKSHWIMFEKIMVELAQRGHDVDVVTHFPLENTVPRYNEINIRGSTPIITNNFTLDLVDDRSITEILKLITTYSGTNICQSSFNTKELQQLKNSTKKYDVVISELFTTDCMLGWAWHFNAHSVVMTSSEHLPWGPDRFGLPDNPAYIPNYFVEYTSKMSFYERIINTWILIKTKILFEIYSAKNSNTIAKEFFGKDLPDLKVLAYNTSLHLINTHFSISNSRPLVANVIEVAGLHLNKPRPVNDHFNQLLETDTNGIIYFSMGSLLLTESFPPHILQAIFDALSEVPYKVLWKGTRKNFPKELTFPSNIHFESWMPQHDILCDSRVKLFISHGGMMGTQESVNCGKPILGIPIFADQTLNLRRAEAAGYSIMLNLKTITKYTFTTALRKILSNPAYTTSAKTISVVFNDRTLSPLEASIYWIEYIIRHNGALHLQSAAKELAWYQYYLVDVIFVMVMIPSTIAYTIYILCKIAVKEISKKTKIKTN